VGKHTGGRKQANGEHFYLFFECHKHWFLNSFVMGFHGGCLVGLGKEWLTLAYFWRNKRRFLIALFSFSRLKNPHANRSREDLTEWLQIYMRLLPGISAKYFYL
jgi:hypothetical protein